MSKIPSMDENPEGFHTRYLVSKADGSETDPSAEYLVLRVDTGGSDPVHIKACRKAAMVFATEIKDHLPKVAADIFDRYGDGTQIKEVSWDRAERISELPNIEEAFCNFIEDTTHDNAVCLVRLILESDGGTNGQSN